jgi:lipopolysaccharide transport system ATP-binding protein
MSDTVIAVENLSKAYLIQHSPGPQGYKRYTALRDVIGDEVRNLARKTFAAVRGRQASPARETEEFWALKDVSFEVKQGEVLGIIGRNGAGKSTLLKILSRITEPTAGWVILRGRVASLLEVGTGFHPELTGRENIYLNGAILGMTRAEIRRKFDEIVAFAETERFLDTPVKHYSSGMYVRLAFAVAAHLEPEILVVDEVLAVGDAEFQKKCLGKIDEVSRRNGRTVLLVSHNMATIQSLSDKAMLLERGRPKSFGSVIDVVEQYTHPTFSDNKSFNRANCNHTSEECDIIDAWIEINGTRFISSIDWDQEFSFVIVLEVHSALTCSPELLIRDAAGVPILFAPTGLYSGFAFKLAAGRHELRAVCSGLRLASGLYYVDIAVAYSGIKFYVYYESALCLEISDRAFGPTNWYYTQRHRQACVPLILDTSAAKI